MATLCVILFVVGTVLLFLQAFNKESPAWLTWGWMGLALIALAMVIPQLRALG